MRTAILTDVHSNLPALSAVLSHCDGLGVDRYVCLGDTVGYGAQPNECCELIRERVSFTLLGNHDAAVSGRMRYDDYYDAAREALDWTREQLSPANLAWLTSLPYAVREGPVGYSHGSPIEPEQYEYIFLVEHARELLPVVEDLPHVTFMGHSHLPRAYAMDEGKVKNVLADEVDLRPRRRFLVSIGSVGQPRDGDPRACVAVYDDEAEALQFHRVAYEIERTAARIVEAGLAEHFARRLFAGV